jgi:hypothetical protein
MNALVMGTEQVETSSRSYLYKLLNHFVFQPQETAGGVLGADAINRWLPLQKRVVPRGV